MKLTFLLLVLVHGLIHSLGMIRAFDWMQLKEFTAEVSRGMGLLWLTASLLFLLFGLVYYWGWRHSLYIGVAAVLLSQILILLYWKDARFGTLPNLIIVIVLLIHWANSRFDHQVSVELEKLFAPHPAAWVESSAAVVLPAPVQRWLDRSGATDQPGYRKVKLVQEFQLRLKPEQKTWYRGEATQYFNTVRPGFIWTLSLDILPLVKIRGRDLLLDGKGEMQIKLWSLFALVSEKNNPKIDEGTLQRFLGEMVWFPWMATSPYIEWEAGTDETAKATLFYKGHAVSGTFEFDQEGKFRKFRTDRYLGGNAHAKRHPWVITAEKHGVHQNIEIPTHCKASWILDDGRWNWAIISVSSARYDH